MQMTTKYSLKYTARVTPIINGPQLLNITAGETFSATYSARDTEGNLITLNMTGLPVGATFNTTTGIFSWTPLALTEVPNLRLFIS